MLAGRCCVPTVVSHLPHHFSISRDQGCGCKINTRVPWPSHTQATPSLSHPCLPGMSCPTFSTDHALMQAQKSCYPKCSLLMRTKSRKAGVKRIPGVEFSTLHSSTQGETQAHRLNERRHRERGASREKPKGRLQKTEKWA